MAAKARSGLIHEPRLVAIAVIPVVAASIVGQIATYPNLTPWYAGLVKPSFNPPNWVFAPVWTTALCPEGVRGVAGFAVATTNRHASGRLGAVLRPVGAGVVLDVFRGPEPGARCYQHHSATDGNHCNTRRFPAARCRRGPRPHSTRDVGNLCSG